MKLLPTNRQEMRSYGWDELDVIFVTADAYCDHPSFGTALLSRLLQDEGFRVGVIAQPDWKKDDDFLRLGRPHLFFGVSAGNLDSMLNLYTSQKNPRKTDKYSPGGTRGLRPGLPTIVYTNRLKSLFQRTPVVIGGLEASMRRLAYYDFWNDRVRRSILFDSKADLLVYGMAERQVTELAHRLKKGESLADIGDIRGTVVNCKEIDSYSDAVVIPSYEEVINDKEMFRKAFNLYSSHLDPRSAKTVAQKTGDRYCVQLPPALPLTEKEMDRIYGLKFTRRAHPRYQKYGGVPAMKTVEASIVSHRGCAGNCSFCSLSLHQGRLIQSRSIASITREASLLAQDRDFKGVVTDVGGPTANLYAASCENLQPCSRDDCLWPAICSYLRVPYEQLLKMLDAVKRVKGVKKVGIQSGLRYDLLLSKGAGDYLRALCRDYISGQLKVAPEHADDAVLDLMHKPRLHVYQAFTALFKKINGQLKKDQYLVGYYITAHPGCDEKAARVLADFVARQGFHPEQIQDFIPLPMTRSSCMYYTGMDPRTGRPLYVPRSRKERHKQRAMVQSHLHKKNTGPKFKAWHCKPERKRR